MGYDLHITRADEWIDSKDTPISFDEWVAYVEHDKELSITGYTETKLPNGQVLRMESEGLALWKKKNFLKQTEVWFYYHDGEITVKNPDESIIKKMKQIAQNLNARVVGDEDEEY